MDNYKILVEESPDDLSRIVNVEMVMGYEPLGAPFIKPENDYSGVKFCQAMIYKN